MSQKMNRKAILLGALGILALIGLCFACVAFYAKREINKPKFVMPEQEAPPSLTERLTNKDEAVAYVMQKYNDLLASDDVEVSWRTDVRRLNEAWETPFSEADDAILSVIRENAGDQLKAFYPQVSHVRMTEAQDVPSIAQQAGAAIDYTLTQGRENDKKEIVDADRYFLTIRFEPKIEDTQTLLDSEPFRKIADELSPVFSLTDTQIEPESVSMQFEIECINEALLSVEIRRDMRISAAVTPSENASALVKEQGGRIVMPYGTTQRIEFFRYGAHFTQRAMAVKPRDIKTLPAMINVNAEATSADFKLTFTASEPDLLTFEDGALMNVGKESFDGPVTVTMTLEYEGKTYTDQMIVYITDLEVNKDV